jgi:hypothetical protein
LISAASLEVTPGRWPTSTGFAANAFIAAYSVG